MDADLANALAIERAIARLPKSVRGEARRLASAGDVAGLLLLADRMRGKGFAAGLAFFQPRYRDAVNAIDRR